MVLNFVLSYFFKKVLNFIPYENSFCLQALEFLCHCVLRLSKERNLARTNRFQVKSTKTGIGRNLWLYSTSHGRIEQAEKKTGSQRTALQGLPFYCDRKLLARPSLTIGTFSRKPKSTGFNFVLTFNSRSRLVMNRQVTQKKRCDPLLLLDLWTGQNLLALATSTNKRPRHSPIFSGLPRPMWASIVYNLHPQKSTQTSPNCF